MLQLEHNADAPGGILGREENMQGVSRNLLAVSDLMSLNNEKMVLLAFQGRFLIMSHTHVEQRMSDDAIYVPYNMCLHSIRENYVQK